MCCIVFILLYMWIIAFDYISLMLFTPIIRWVGVFWWVSRFKGSSLNFDFWYLALVRKWINVSLIFFIYLFVVSNSIGKINNIFCFELSFWYRLIRLSKSYFAIFVIIRVPITYFDFNKNAVSEFSKSNCSYF